MNAKSKVGKTGEKKKSPVVAAVKKPPGYKIEVAPGMYMSFPMHQIEAGIQASVGDGALWSTAHVVAAGGALDVARMLVEAGCQLNARSGYGRSLLHFAAQRANMDLLNLLIVGGAELDAHDQDFRTPLDLAALAGHGAIVERLIEAGAGFMGWLPTDESAVDFAIGEAKVVLARYTLAEQAKRDRKGKRVSKADKRIF